MGRRFAIAEFSFQVDCGGDILATLADDWRDFQTSEPPRTRIELELTPAVTRAADWRPLLPDVNRTADGALAIAGDDFQARVEPDRRFARVISPPERFPVEAVVRVLLADFLLAREGLLLHSVGVGLDGRAAVFVGQSGAGKTTLGGLCRQAGLFCLSDELVAIVPTGGGYRAFGTPWNVGASAHAELRMLGLLEHAPSPSVHEQPAAELLRTVLPNALMPDLSPSTRARMFRLACTLIGSVQRVRLRFAPDTAAAMTLARALQGDEADPSSAGLKGRTLSFPGSAFAAKPSAANS